MKTKDYISLKKAKPFEFNDLFIYLAVAITVVALFLAFVIFPDGNKNDGFCVYKGKTQVLTFYYDGKLLDVNEQFFIQQDDVKNGIYLTVYHTQDKNSYNKLYIDLIAKSVVMVDSTCSNSKDCTHSPAIKNSGAIYCAPHDLKIVPIDGDGRIPPTTGGLS
ncbi:MAG: hypothetical protein IJV95_01995 [Clostridia bacterium]|nr:hypothetical protein [Clostridia bacterium]